MATNTGLYALGHSNRTLEFLVGLLLGYGVDRLIDIRRYPWSPRNPQFNQDDLARNLRTVGIAYTHLPGLGGRRRAQANSPNAGWKNSMFRGYADYMATPAFERNLRRLLAFAERETVAFMCSEAVPWRCHRSLVADALVARRIPVRQIMSRVSAPEHRLTPFAVIKGEKLHYPPGAQVETLRRSAKQRFDALTPKHFA